MVEFKLVIADPKTGKSYKHEVKGTEASKLVGMKLGEKLNGDLIGLAGYEFEITGGSDYCGFPMRKDLDGIDRKKIYTVKSVGIKKVKKGERLRKMVCGNTIHARISQVNLKILKYGKSPLAGAEGKEEKKEEKKTESKEEKKGEVKAEKKEEKKEEKKTEIKEEHKEEKKNKENQLG